MKRATLTLAALALLLGSVGRAKAGPLNPSDFTSLGQLTLGPGVYTVNTDTLQLTGTGINFTGVSSGGSAVFDFSQINLSAGLFGYAWRRRNAARPSA